MNKIKIVVILFPLIAGWLLGGCQTSKQKMATSSKFRIQKAEKSYQDDLNLYGLGIVLNNTIKALDKNPNGQMNFGDRVVKNSEYSLLLKKLAIAIDKDMSGEAFYSALKENFNVYEAHTGDEWGKVFITSYYSPVLEAGRRPNKKLTEPIYELPKDSVHVNLNAYADAVPALKKAIEEKPDLFPRGRLWRGRIVQNADRSEVVPYYSRKEISAQKKIKAKVIAYVDPIDAFFLHIQGSGTLKFKDGREIAVGYAGQNGWPYYAIGAALTSQIPLEDMSQQKIENYLRSQSTEERDRILSLNPSYIFFNSNLGGPKTYMGTSPTPGRTIATDSMYYPKGALAYLSYPVLKETETGLLTSSKELTSRFVVDQDTGGAIKGPARVDLYWGRDEWAKIVAGHMKGNGRLLYFVPR